MAKLNYLLIVSLVLSVSVSCNKQEPPKLTDLSSSASACSNREATSDKLFEIDGKIITINDLTPQLREYIFQNEYETYSKNKMMYQEFALRYYLAKKQNKLKDPKNPPALAELLKSSTPSEKKLKVFFKKNRSHIPPNVTFDQIKGQLVKYMQQKQMGDIFKKKITEMEKSGVFKSLVVAPISPQIEFNIANFPTKGNKDSKIKIVEISDYMCGHCQSAHTKVIDLLKKYGDKVSFTQINMSLSPKGLSGAYARGAFCANKQGTDKFWKYHDKTFKVAAVPHDHNKPGHKHEKNDGNSKESLTKVTDIAKIIGLDIKKFSTCLSSKDALKNIESINDLLTSKGISSTPVFIVNNKKLAKGIMELEEVIKSQL